MRLLSVHTLDFHDFFNQDVPPYAIASHRWVEHEATFKQVRKKENTTSAGYQKVRNFADYVKQHEPSIEWLWIDTCCINKESSRELEEAINSMFLWYRRAPVCLAYLADVPSSTDMEAFKDSVWFRRGWTLQELLAPRIVIFLANDWTVIGHKKPCDTVTVQEPLAFELGAPLNDTIASITHIPSAVLGQYERCQDLKSDDILEWMDHRYTTKEEDRWYCLVGIFDMPMSIIYGGQDPGIKTRDRFLEKLKKKKLLSTSLAGRTKFGSDVSLSSLALQLLNDGHQMKLFFSRFANAPTSLIESAEELQTFGYTLNILDRNFQSHRHTVKIATAEQCVLICNRACGQIRSAVGRLEVLKGDSKYVSSPFLEVADKAVVKGLCNELDQARTSLQLAFQTFSTYGQILYPDRTVHAFEDEAFKHLEYDRIRIVAEGSSRQRQLGSPNFQEHMAQSSQLQRRVADNTGIHGENNCTFLAVSDPSDQANARSRSRRWRLRFTPWFTSQVWQFSLQAMQTGWTFNLRSTHLVADDSPIFEACRDGDLEVVQMLFREGKASPFDYSCDDYFSIFGDTLLSAAATSGNVELCRYLLEIGGYPIMRKDSFDPLSVFYSGNASATESLEMYQLILKQPEWNVDELLRTDRGYPWFWRCPDVDCMRLIRSEFAIFFSQLPWETQFGLAIENIVSLKDSLPVMFLARLGRYAVDSRIARAHSWGGNTALHVVAHQIDTLALDRSDIPTTWVKFVQELIHYGAALHSQNKAGRTPLLDTLRSYSRSVTGNLQTWVKLLAMAGVDIQKYGETESAMLKTLYPDGLIVDDFKTYRIEGLSFGPNPQDWFPSVTPVKYVPIFKPEGPPGKWPVLEHGIPWTICWRPEDEDYATLEMPWQWEESEVRTIYGKRHSNSAEVDDDETVTPGEDDVIAQDDCRETMLLIYQSTKTRPRPRSYSAPSLKAPVILLKEWRAETTPESHICPFDGQRRFGSWGLWGYGSKRVYPISDRKCAEGVHLDGHQYLEAYYQGIEKQMRRHLRKYRRPTNL